MQEELGLERSQSLTMTDSHTNRSESQVNFYQLGGHSLGTHGGLSIGVFWLSSTIVLSRAGCKGGVLDLRSIKVS